jgi:flagellar motor protein MotB
MGRKHKHPEHENLERWLVSYADFITLLFATFTALYAISVADLAKFKDLKEGIKQAFQQQSFMGSIKSIMEGPPPAPPNIISKEQGQGNGVMGQYKQMTFTPGDVESKKKAQAALEGLKSEIKKLNKERRKKAAMAAEKLKKAKAAVKSQGAEGGPKKALGGKKSSGTKGEKTGKAVQVSKTSQVNKAASSGGKASASGKGVSKGKAPATSPSEQSIPRDIELTSIPQGIKVTFDSQMLFESGSAGLMPEARKTLNEMMAKLKDIAPELYVQVEGHTDNQPISTAVHPSNWELSTARASAVVRNMIQAGQFPPSRLSAVGYADSRPIATNGTLDGRHQNRRIEILILTQPPGYAGEGLNVAAPNTAALPDDNDTKEMSTKNTAEKDTSPASGEQPQAPSQTTTTAAPPKSLKTERIIKPLVN